LADLIGLEESEPKPAAPLPSSDWEAREFANSPPRPVEWETSEPVGPAPAVRRPSLAAVAIGCALLVVAVTICYLAVIFRANQSEIPRSVTDGTTVLERIDATVRTRATNQLISKLKELPTVAAQPSNTFYDSLAITILDPPAPLSVLIRGTETTVSPETHEAISRTDFVVTADYRQERWFFTSYHASANDLVHKTAVRIERDDRYPIAPAIVSLLGLEVRSD